jgi:hypothetical protein
LYEKICAANFRCRGFIVGIVSLELAYNSEIADNIIKSWTAHNVITVAVNNILFDFIFIILYTAFFSIACKRLAQKYDGFPNTAGVFLSKAMIAAGMLDVLENTGMLITLHRHINDAVTLLTAGCATVKFTIIIAAAVYLFKYRNKWKRKQTGKV